MASPLAREHALVWGSRPAAAGSKEDRAWELCRQYIDRRVAGVFFAPLELTPAKDEVNLRIAQALDDARIPIILLDRTVLPYPQRGHHDLVGIDNRRAGYLITEHLLRLGSRRIAFVGVATPPRPSTHARPATVRRSQPGTSPTIARAGTPPGPGGCGPRARPSWNRRVPRRSSAPTTGRPRA